MSIKIKNISPESFTVFGYSLDPNDSQTIATADIVRLCKDPEFRMLLAESELAILVNERQFTDETAQFWADRAVGGVLTGVAPKRVSKFIEASGAATIHTVTAGHTFYLTHLSINALNTAASAARLMIRDGASTTRIPFGWGAQPALGQPAIFSQFMDLSKNPEPFSTDLRTVHLAGSITASIYIAGYEE